MKQGSDQLVTKPPEGMETRLSRILAAPTVADLWDLQADLLAIGGDQAERARKVAGAFHGCLRSLESKVASRNASRWGAALATASVTSVSIQEALAEQEKALRRLFASGVTALLEIASAVKSVQAWEVEASLMYYDAAWCVYGELWDISVLRSPALDKAQRKEIIDNLLAPVINPDIGDATKSALMIALFKVILAERMQPLLADTGSA